jgi:biopolymer transport protein ExbD
MRYPRNARILRTQLDMAPFATVFFLLTLFVFVGALMPMPGLPLNLPEPNERNADKLAALDEPSVAVAIDAHGRLYFGDQMVTEAQFRSRLREAVQKTSHPLALVVLADKAVPYGQLYRVWLLAREVGVRDIQHAVLPRAFEGPATTFSP